MAYIRKRLDYDPDESPVVDFESVKNEKAEVVVSLTDSPGRQCRQRKTQDVYGSLDKAHREPETLAQARPGRYSTSYREAFTPGEADKVSRLPRNWHNRSDNTLSDHMGTPFKAATEFQDRFQGFKVQYGPPN